MEGCEIRNCEVQRSLFYLISNFPVVFFNLLFFLNFTLLNFFLVNFLNVNFRAVLKAHAQDSPTGVTTTATTLFVLHIELYICLDLIKGTSGNCKYVLTI